MPDRVPVRRALLSVSDKTGLIPFARALAAHGAELISTGGTAQALAAAGLPVTPIDRLTGFPEMMGGRVKTLHPMVHGGLLAVRDDPGHAAALAAHGIRPIDLVCINLYPFEETIAQRAAVSEADAVEQIDIGGPAMIRSGAKNFEWVAVVTSTGQYERVTADLAANAGATTRCLRADLAAAAFARTAEYDAAIAAFVAGRPPAAYPDTLYLRYPKVADLRYGENPHQRAALYRDPSFAGPSVVSARQLHGKELSYNNINDAAAALELALALAGSGAAPGRVAACVVKHTNPCGAALAVSARDAVDAALAGDPLAAYGGILASSAPLDPSAAQRLCARDTFLEVIIAPAFDDAAANLLRERWSHVRLLAFQTPGLRLGEEPGGHPHTSSRAGATGPAAPAETPPPPAAPLLDYRSIPGGLLAQDRDMLLSPPAQWRHVAGPPPDPDVLAWAAAMETVIRFLSSNAVCIGGAPNGDTARGAVPRPIRLLGAGAGQMDRLAACRIAIAKAGDLAKGAVVASDAFFPFPDGPQALIDAGVRLIVHPGGSKRDQDTFDLCNARGVTCMVTGVRRFKH